MVTNFFIEHLPDEPSRSDKSGTSGAGGVNAAVTEL
jgi:hypothetical protein